MTKRSIMLVAVVLATAGCTGPVVNSDAVTDEGRPSQDQSTLTDEYYVRWASELPIDWDSPAIQATRGLAEALRLSPSMRHEFFPGVAEAFVDGNLSDSSDGIEARGFRLMSVESLDRAEIDGRVAIRSAVCEDNSAAEFRAPDEAWTRYDNPPQLSWYLAFPPKGDTADPLRSPQTSTRESRQRYPTWDVFGGYRVKKTNAHFAHVPQERHRELMRACEETVADKFGEPASRLPNTWFPGWLQPTEE